MKININKELYFRYLSDFHQATKEIVGQNNVLKELANKLFTSLAQETFWLKEKPTVLFLAWPSRVWKTLFAKKTAQLIKTDYVLIPMGNFKAKGCITSLIWGGPSYVGYDNKWIIWNFLISKNKPKVVNKNEIYLWLEEKQTKISSMVENTKSKYVFIFDEIEKAHEDLNPFFLELLDEWQITFWDGSVLSMKNSIIIFTSNLWVNKLKTSQTLNESKQTIISEIKKFFPNELYNRFGWEDWIFLFEPLSKEAHKEIFKNKILATSDIIFDKLEIKTKKEQTEILDFVLKEFENIQIKDENITILQEKVLDLFLRFLRKK